MAQYSQSKSIPSFQTSAAFSFWNHLLSTLFYLGFAGISLVFLTWSVQIVRQSTTQTESQLTGSITSLVREPGINGIPAYLVTYAFTTEGSADQAVFHKQEPVPAALFYRLKPGQTIPLLADGGQTGKITIDHELINATTLELVPVIMALLGAGLSVVTLLLLFRSLHFSWQSLQLNRLGVMSYGYIFDKIVQSHRDREAEHHLVYKFQLHFPEQESHVQSCQEVNYQRFRSMQKGEVVRVRYLPHAPHVSRIEF